MIFTSHIHWFALLCLLASAAAFSFWTYRTTIPPISRGKRMLLIALRAAALWLILLLIAEPLLRLTHMTARRPVIALVADNTLSMTLNDGKGSREAHLRAIFSDPAWERLSRDAMIERYAIAPELTRVSADSLALKGVSTDIASALAHLLEQQSQAPAAIVLLSDGNYNTGSNPLTVAERSNVPIFTVGIGDSSEQKDASVSKVTGNSIAYVESTVPVDAVIKVSGYTSLPLRVELLEDGRPIDTQTLTTAPSTEASEYQLRFSYVPKSEGTKKLTVRIGALAQEETEKNNSRSFIMKVLKNKFRILVLAGAPSADVAAMMQMLEGDKNSEPSVFYQMPDGHLRAEKTTAAFPAAAAAADCLVLVGFPTSPTTPQTMQTVLSTVGSRNVPLFFIAGRTIDLMKLRQLEPILPFTVAGSRIDEQQVVASIPASQQSNELVNAGQSAMTWEKLPPIYSTLGVFKAKPEAAVLATMKMQGVALSAPLIVSRSVGSQKSIAILGYGVDRWKLMAGASPETQQFFDSWFSTASRWLAVREEDKRLRVDPEKELFSQGEPVQFTGQAYTETLDPLENADIRLEALDLGTRQKFETSLHSIGAGRYDGSLTGLPEGEYAFTATAQFSSQTIGTVHGRFSVGEQSLEFSDTKLNSTLMRQIASLSGGTYADMDAVGMLQDRLKQSPALKPEEKASVRDVDMWNAPMLFFVIIIMAGTEWFIRKRSGMV